MHCPFPPIRQVAPTQANTEMSPVFSCECLCNPNPDDSASEIGQFAPMICSRDQFCTLTGQTMNSDTHPPLHTLEDLRGFVHARLCQTENLLEEQFRTLQRPLYAKGELCAVEFTLHGLRSVRLGAIWAADQNVVYLYNARGERSEKIILQQRPDTQMLAAS